LVETKSVAGWVLDQILVMLHPFMPFVTEELWHGQGERPYDLILAKWPEPEAAVDAKAKAEVDWLIRTIAAIRSARTELNIPPGTKMSGFVDGGGDAFHAMLRLNWTTINRLARIDLRQLNNVGPDQPVAFQVVQPEATYWLQLEGVIDVAAEKARLTRAREAASKEAESLETRLANPAFVERAKPEAVEKARADHAHHTAEAARLEAALARLG
jgi:valyl-tRNA synthetase